MEAHYAGDCPDCTFGIKVGEDIQLAWDMMGEREYWRHKECPKEKPTKFEGTTLADMGFDD